MAASTSLTAQERSLRARLAAHTRWAHASKDERTKQGQAAQRGLLERFACEVDPDGVLDPDERYQRARSALNAHMARLSLQSSKARRSDASVASDE